MTNDHQLEILRAYGALAGEREDWAGALVLSCGEGAATSGISAAVGIAGGTTLTIDANAPAVKAAMRRGEIDFVVNTLDEALRTLKNEIRQLRPLSVGLIADLGSALCEMVERGVGPDLLLVGTNQPMAAIVQDPEVRKLEASGMPVRLLLDRDSAQSPPPAVILNGKRYSEFYLSARNTAELRELNRKLLEMIPVDDLVRRRWIQRSPHYLRGAQIAGVWTWLSDEEHARRNEQVRPSPE